jgi:cobalt-zinc-cadmium efflux system outer membrane protein
LQVDGGMQLVAATAVVVTFCAAALPAQTPALSGPLTYNQALDLASSRNLALAAARRARAIREGALRTAGLRPNPSASFEASRDTPHEVFVFEVPVELGGKRGRRIELAKEELTLADVDVQTEMRTLRRDLRQAFYSLIAADERIRLADSLVVVTRRVHDVAQAQFEVGAVPRLDVMASDLGVARAETDLELARGIRAFEQARLNAVLNLPPQQPPAIVGSLSDGIAVTYESALQLATTSNVELIALDRQIAVEERRVALLRAERTPTPTFLVSGLFNNPGEFTAGPGAGVSVELPLFSRNQGQIAESLATTAQLRARRDATLRTIENSIAGIVARIEAQRRQIEAFERRLVPTVTDLQALAEESYRAGRTSVLGLIESQRSLRELRREALQAALDLQLSIAELEEILGTALR